MTPSRPEPVAPKDPVEVRLSARDLVRTFSSGSSLRPRRVSAVDGVSLDLHAGEVLGVVGESGCGKSTLARMLVGLDRPDAGTLTYRGDDVSRGRRADRVRLRRGVQMIFQDPFTSLDPRLTVDDLVAEPLAATGVGTRSFRRDRVAELLDMVGLSSEVMSRYAHQFSGGQRQRIGIARALALDPDVLICDEPVSALDVSVQAQVINLLDDLRARLGVSVLFIAHDLSVVRHVADRVAVMYLGRIAEIAPTDALYETPSHPYTQALLSAAPTVDRAGRGRLARRHILQGEPPSPLDPPSGCRFHPRCRLASEVCTRTQPRLSRRAGSTGAAEERALVACHHAEEARSEP